MGERISIPRDKLVHIRIKIQVRYREHNKKHAPEIDGRQTVLQCTVHNITPCNWNNEITHCTICMMNCDCVVQGARTSRGDTKRVCYLTEVVKSIDMLGNKVQLLPCAKAETRY